MAIKPCSICGDDAEADDMFDQLCKACEAELQEFWDKQDEKQKLQKSLMEICNKDFMAMHKHVLELIGRTDDRFDRRDLAILLTGDYHMEAFRSRGQSGRLAILCELDGDYLELYCSSSSYAELRFDNLHPRCKHPSEKGLELLKAYEQADKLDREGYNGHLLRV